MNLDKLGGKRAATLVAYMQIILGCIIGGAAYPLFLVPGKIAPGGLSGLAMILNHLFAFPVGMTSLVMNIPLFIIGYKAMGRSFVVRSLFAMILFSLCIDTIRLPAMTLDPMLSTIFGGIVLGVGLGLIMRGGATTGGTDMMARMVHARMPILSTGMILLIFDCIVVVAAAFFIGATEALYALISIFVSSKALDLVLMGLTTNKACFIISDAWELVTQRLLNEMERGVTHLTARGAYSGKERPVVLCVLPPQEVARMKQIVQDADEKAFMFITDVHEALGEGFSPLNNENQ